MDGFAVWLTGLPGAGKSTLAAELASILRERSLRVEILDGGSARADLSPDLGYTPDHRRLHVDRLAAAAAHLTQAGTAVLVASTSPHRDARDGARSRIPQFVEVFVKAPIEVLIVNDSKGLYSRAIRREIAHFPGVSEVYEAPHAPEVVVDREYHTVYDGVQRILRALESRGYVPAPADGRAAVPHLAR